MAEFLIQRVGCYVGNDLLWWRPKAAGYTTNIDEAGRYTEQQAEELCSPRGNDKAWPLAEVEARAARVVQQH